MAALSHFLNLDLVLRSPADFTALIAHLDQSVYVLHHQQHEQQFLLVLETNGTEAPDPIRCTQQFLTLVESLPSTATELWNGCTSRTFSYGFEGGCKFRALDTTIPADLLLRIARLGANIGITVYPYRSDDSDGSQRKNKPVAHP
ncbi:hypothetical protein SSBR45G_25960 [Bradyrhizobium sp. SSBR45G]|uniref:hypothetical protein n=1 Tax=unclassified Bradyrhizobium TaxID=2631580 RepID=UPI002342AB62|nr:MULTISPECIES: hypothetical protein [unclassified Bradyrhizobium]GLH77688.1 hypothetical protein SSBR45G_25960 [Bradyrhizobium sp. SSBR45G]GLH84925.1 hypothetical protein SSBR45R_23850 [Bradyrhizobium sp. SSBR45R]